MFNKTSDIINLCIKCVGKEKTSYLHFTEYRPRNLINEIIADKKTFVCRNAHPNHPTLIMSKSEYLERYSMKYDVIYYVQRTFEKGDIEILPKLFRILNDNGFIIASYYHFRTAVRLVMYINSSVNDFTAYTFMIRDGAMIVICKDGSEKIGLNLEQIIEITKDYPEVFQAGVFDGEIIDKEKLKYLNIKQDEFLYELARRNYPNLIDHIKEIINF